MPNVAVVTDSVASIPESLVKALNIHWVAYYIHRGQEVLRDLVTVQSEEFLKWLETAKILPTTASPGPGDYVKKYVELVENQGVTDIVSVHITSKGSGAYQAAKIAQSIALEQYPKLHIEVIDTQNVALCQGWMVIEAARAALAGKNMDEVANTVKKMIPITRMIQTADTLKYLYMGGRIGRAQHLVGTLLNIKPLIGMVNGEIVALGTARSRSRAYQAMVDMVETAVGVKGKIKIAYVHAAALTEVQKLKSMVEERFTVVESLIADLSPALAVHSGPGTAGVCYFPVDG
jgi:DegV family protein with EDD domain